MISVIGHYTTKFGELWDSSLYDLVSEAIEGAVKDAGLEYGHIDAVFFGNMLGGVLENNLHSGAKIAEIMGLHIPVFRFESACASGGIAFHNACQYAQSGTDKTVLVVGAEKMTDFQNGVVISALSAAASGEEQEAGQTFPGLYAMLARVYMSKYNVTERDLALISVKNHLHGARNENAQFRREITVDAVMQSPYVADPIKVLDSSPVSDGASAVVVTSDESLSKKSKHVVRVLSSAVATDTISLAKRERLDELKATRIAAKKAFTESQIRPDDVDIAEVHDCFTIAELLAMEDLGFYKKGTAINAVRQYAKKNASFDGPHINTSGGLKAAGHPVGATGIKQIGELFLQLTGSASGRQVKHAEIGLAHNVGGSGGTAVVSVLSST